MSNILFPHLYGLAFDVKMGRVDSTVHQSAWTPGHETRLAKGSDPIRKFSLHYKVLDDGLKYDSLNTIDGFFHDRNASFDSFLLKISDVGGTSASVTGQVLTPDGGRNAPFIRPFGRSGSVETVFELGGVNGNPGSAPVVKMSGTPLTAGSDYTIQGPGLAVDGNSYAGMVAVITATITGPITADFTWYYRVTFEQGDQEYDLFHYLLWEAQEIKLIETRTP